MISVATDLMTVHSKERSPSPSYKKKIVLLYVKYVKARSITNETFIKYQNHVNCQ